MQAMLMLFMRTCQGAPTCLEAFSCITIAVISREMVKSFKTIVYQI